MGMMMPSFRTCASLALFAVSAALPTPLIAKTSSAARESDNLAKKRAVLDVEHQLLQARVNSDTSIHKMNFTDDAMYMHSSGRFQNKAEVLQMVAERPWVSWSKAEQEVQIFGDIAVTHSLLSVRLTDNRMETVRATGVYVNQSDKWRQVSWQSSAGRFVGPGPDVGK